MAINEMSTADTDNNIEHASSRLRSERWTAICAISYRDLIYQCTIRANGVFPADCFGLSLLSQNLTLDSSRTPFVRFLMSYNYTVFDTWWPFSRELISKRPIEI